MQESSWAAELKVLELEDSLISSLLKPHGQPDFTLRQSVVSNMSDELVVDEEVKVRALTDHREAVRAPGSDGRGRRRLNQRYPHPSVEDVEVQLL